MHVLMTADTCGGVWTQATELCRGLSERGHRVTLATSGGLPTDDQRTALDGLPGVNLHATAFKLEWQPDAAADVHAFGDMLETLCAQVRPDVVHLNEFAHGARRFAVADRRRASRPVPKLVVGHSDVCSWHAAVRGCEAGPEWDAYRRSVAAGLRAADAVAAPTAWMLGQLEQRFGPLPSPRVIPNGLSLANKASGGASAPRAGDVAPGTHGGLTPHRSPRPHVFAAGRYWDAGKNLAALAEIAPRLDVPVRLAGLPSPDGTVDPPAGVTFLGRLNAGEMTAAYRDAAVYCLPAKYEPFGLTPLEAARAGCALVLGDTPSLREVWGDAAVYVNPDDRDALSDGLHHVLKHGGELADRALAAVERSTRYTRAAMTDDYLQTYSDLCRSASRTLEASGTPGSRATTHAGAV